MMVVTQVTDFLSLLVLFADVFIVMLLVLLLVPSVRQKGFLSELWSFLRRHALTIGFVAALISMSGSLFFSEIAKYTPCELCWFQRICMYPQVLLLGIAAWKRDVLVVKRYFLPLAVVGGVIAAYQYVTQVAAVTSFCSADAVSCSSSYVFHLGYITIPMMAFTGFALIVLSALIAKRR